jgi:hypothetical protein
MIEVPHEGTKRACLQIVDLFLRTGSHFLTHADWGCKDGEHKSWIIVDVESKEEALGIIPPPYRAQAKVVQLNSFTLSEIDELLQSETS